MNSIKKHSFEAVSLLTADNGVLDITIIPAVNQLDWVIPSNLILSIDDYHERIWTYLWNNQEVSVYHLIPREETPDKLIILEGNTDVHRIAIQTKGELKTKQVRISDVKDADLPESLKEKITMSSEGEESDIHNMDEMSEHLNTINNESSDEIIDKDTVSTNETIDTIPNNTNTNDVSTEDMAGGSQLKVNDETAEEEIIELAVPQKTTLIDDNFLIDDDALIDDDFFLEEKDDGFEEPEYESFVIDDVEEEVEAEDSNDLEKELNQTLIAEIRKAHDIKFPYIFQSVMIDNELFLVPDLDTISHRLVDLDG